MSTGRPIDHLVVAVRDLNEAARRYEALGFTLTPRAAHNDRMGTSNRLAQFSGHNFIELLEVDRPDTLDEHAPDERPPRFSFGAHNREFLRARSGLSMLVFASNDAHADAGRFEQAGLQTYAPYDFERQAALPDGSEVTVGFSLAFATSPRMPQIAFFVCENRSPELFWKPGFQSHENGAQGITAVYLCAREPEIHGEFLGGLFGGSVQRTGGGISVSCGPRQTLRVLNPDAIDALTGSVEAAAGTTKAIRDGDAECLFAGARIVTAGAAGTILPASQACGLFIEWVDSSD